MGYTGLGVASTRFGAATMLDLLDGEETERTAQSLVENSGSIGLGLRFLNTDALPSWSDQPWQYVRPKFYLLGYSTLRHR